VRSRNAGQSEFEVVFGAAADTAGVTSLSLGLWGRDPVTGLEVALTPEDGTYEMIVGASSIAMLASMPFAKGLPGPTTKIRMPTLQMRAVESFSLVGDTLVARPVRVPAITWTEGIEVSHQGVAIASAYAGTTRVIVLMSNGPGREPVQGTNWHPGQSAAEKIPPAWGTGQPNSKGDGWRWQDPANPGNGVRIDRGSPGNSQPSQQPDHVIVRHNGRVIGRDGSPISGSIRDNPQQAHIPLVEWLQWTNWFGP
jgi:hypothetical protein